MVRAIEAAQKVARKALERTYKGKASVVEHRKDKNPETKLVEYQDVMVLENIPCKLSFERLQPVVQSGSAASTVQSVKLFLSPNITIKPGSKITVTQEGVVTDYTYSGVPAIYSTHQEIILELFERWT